MRRNTISIVKYFIYIIMFSTAGFFLYQTMEREAKKIDMNTKRKIPGQLYRKYQHHVSEVQESELKKIDWHDYKLIEIEQQRTGPGERGTAVIPISVDENAKKKLFVANGFNAYVSDMISLDRSVKDIRHEGCRTKTYLNKLPTVSIIVPFHNEHWSTLLRTVHSVINRAPKHLIHEILLVDDFSTKEFLKEKLDTYIKEHFTNVRVIRTKTREGLIRARILGAKAATADVLIFLDSHCEANTNWLPPLLEPMVQDERTVVCPFIDVIDYETFAYSAQDNGARGAFNWKFLYKRLPLLKSDLEHPTEPFKSPVMAGGLFAIWRKWFWTLGGYDPGLNIWGGEQYELSFKIWQCGGKMVDAPCSRIGHVYRKYVPYSSPNGSIHTLPLNLRRVADVWMDEYKEFWYMRHPEYRKLDPGDISEQKAIRKKLNCKSFKWFMTEVAFDLVDVYPTIEPNPLATGEIRNVATKRCVDTQFKYEKERFQLEPCMKDGKDINGEQILEFTWHKDIRPSKRSVCLDVSAAEGKLPVILYVCHNMKHNQRFKYNLDTYQIYHPISRKCLDCDVVTYEIFMNSCNEASNTQKWKWSSMNTTAVREDWTLP